MTPFSLILYLFDPHFHKTLDPIGSKKNSRAEPGYRKFDEVTPRDWDMVVCSKPTGGIIGLYLTCGLHNLTKRDNQMIVRFVVPYSTLWVPNSAK